MKYIFFKLIKNTFLVLIRTAADLKKDFPRWQKNDRDLIGTPGFKVWCFVFCGVGEEERHLVMPIPSPPSHHHLWGSILLVFSTLYWDEITKICFFRWMIFFFPFPWVQQLTGHPPWSALFWWERILFLAALWRCAWRPSPIHQHRLPSHLSCDLCEMWLMFSVFSPCWDVWSAGIVAATQ